MDTIYSLTIPGRISLKQLEKALHSSHTLSPSETECLSAELLDTFDGELSQAGKLLLASEDRLLLIDTLSGVILSQPGKASGLCIDAIEPGPVQSQMLSLSKLRALIPLTALELTTESACMLDDELKTVARLYACTLLSKRRTATLLMTRSLRGYEKEFTLLQNTIENLHGKTRGTLAAILNLETISYNPKPDIALDPAAPIYQSANTIIATFLKVARQNEAGIIADFDTEFLHDYRVSLRKVRSVLSLFKGVYSPEETVRLKKEFSGLMQVTGRLRDLDVYLLERDYYYSLVPPSTHEGLDIMFCRFVEEREQLHKKIKKALKNKEYRKQIEKLSSQCIENRWQKGEAWDQSSHTFAARSILKRYNKVCRIARTIDQTTPDNTVHILRIHCKKLRYLMEFFAPLFDEDKLRTLIKALKVLQDNLGNFNDFSVQQESLATFLDHFPHDDKKIIKVAESIGGLIAMLNYLQQKEKEQVLANFTLFDSEETRTLFHALFSNGD